MSVSVYSCINCGGSVRFDISSKSFKCDFCASKFTLKEVNEAFPDDDEGSLWNKVKEETNGNRDIESDYIINAEENETAVLTYNCPSCAAEIMADSETLAAAFCTFCNNPVNITERLLSGQNMPSRVIPFKITKDEAAAVFQSKTKNKPLIPKKIKGSVYINEFKSVYIPFKLFDAECSGNITATCKNISRWSDSNYEYTKTDTYEARRSGVMEFTQVPLDASKKIDDESIQAIEPFEMSEMVPFSRKFLSGHYAEAPTAQEKDLQDVLRRRLKPAAESTMLGTVGGYSSVSLSSSNVSIDKTSSEYVMFPVWMFITKFKDRDYTFAINGQTGKFTGKFPIDWRYAGVLFVKLALIIFIAVFIGLEVYLWVS